MATIGTLFPTPSNTPATASTSSTSSQTAASSAAASGSDSLANQNTFLQLLVAQLKNQDPTQPMDGTTFVTQLATFSDLQANVGSKSDLDAISKQYLGTVPSSTSSSPASAGGTTATGTTTTPASTTEAASAASAAASAAATLPTDSGPLLTGTGN